MAKYIFITGGVVSSLGKGIASGSIGKLLEARNLKVSLIKCDPYINVDAGTMNPYQHGEVYVTADGAETDLDLGHYERFTHAKITQDNNITTGKVYYSVINKERRGDYLGKTVQIIPHITEEIKNSIKKVALNQKVDVVIVEIGGTVGDIESLPFLEAIRQLRLELGKDYGINIHVTLVPYIKSAGELKSKPTQHSVAVLREIGITPDIIICRCEKPLSKEIKEKIALFCNVEPEAVITALDVKTIYEVPLMFKKEGLDNLISRLLNLKSQDKGLGDWEERVVKRLKYSQREVEIAVVGKYISLQDAYKSIYEALVHGAIANRVRLALKKVDSEDIEKNGAQRYLTGVKGILVAGGFGIRGVEGKIQAIKFARENKLPYLGICLGMQLAIVEFARNICALKGAHSTEFNRATRYPVITMLEEQKKITHKGASMRLGTYECVLKKGTFAYQAYRKERIFERHRHRYEFNNEYIQIMEEAGMRISGINPQRNLVEIIELKDHPWFVACQFHPEFQSKPDLPHPLFRDFLRQALAQ